MKAITTKFHGATNTKGSRITATDADGNRISVSFDHALDSEHNHDAAAIALCRKMGWTGHNLMRGGVKDGNVYVFDAHSNRLRVPEDLR
jgi:hypothetical protein